MLGWNGRAFAAQIAGLLLLLLSLAMGHGASLQHHAFANPIVNEPLLAVRLVLSPRFWFIYICERYANWNGIIYYYRWLWIDGRWVRQYFNRETNELIWSEI